MAGDDRSMGEPGQTGGSSDEWLPAEFSRARGEAAEPDAPLAADSDWREVAGAGESSSEAESPPSQLRRDLQPAATPPPAAQPESVAEAVTRLNDTVVARSDELAARIKALEAEVAELRSAVDAGILRRLRTIRSGS